MATYADSQQKYAAAAWPLKVTKYSHIEDTEYSQIKDAKYPQMEDEKYPYRRKRPPGDILKSGV